MAGRDLPGSGQPDVQSKEDFAFTGDLLEAGKVRPVIGRRHSLDRVPEALRYYEERHAH
jgi:NADPH:quinone reductase-like Zn-dependent oxidoreductase